MQKHSPARPIIQHTNWPWLVTPSSITSQPETMIGEQWSGKVGIHIFAYDLNIHLGKLFIDSTVYNFLYCKYGSLMVAYSLFLHQEYWNILCIQSIHMHIQLLTNKVSKYITGLQSVSTHCVVSEMDITPLE